MDVGTTSHARIPATRTGGPERIDPTEQRGLAIGGIGGLLLGGAVGSLVSGNIAMRAGLQGTQAMDAALLRGGAIGALTGALACAAIGFMVGHVQDEGWTVPGQ